MVNSYLIDASYYFSTGHIHNFELLKKKPKQMYMLWFDEVMVIT